MKSALLASVAIAAIVSFSAAAFADQITKPDGDRLIRPEACRFVPFPVQFYEVPIRYVQTFAIYPMAKRVKGTGKGPRLGVTVLVSR